MKAIGARERLGRTERSRLFRETRRFGDSEPVADDRRVDADRESLARTAVRSAFYVVPGSRAADMAAHR